LGEPEHCRELFALATGRRLNQLKRLNHFQALASAIIDEPLALGGD
jgi:hypothetical protein